MDLQKIIGEQAAALRRKQGLSQEEIAARIGLDQAYISRLEAGKQNITLGTLQLLMDALSITDPKDFFDKR